MALPPFARHTPLLQQSIDISCPPGPQQQTCSSGLIKIDFKTAVDRGSTSDRPVIMSTCAGLRHCRLLRPRHVARLAAVARG